MKNFKYNWLLSNTVFKKDKGTVFSCFSCAGGSTMGYKLAGFDVIGANDIDKKMMEIYKENHNPKYYFLDSIVNLKNYDFPPEFYNLDILDGSPPCSSFSMAGARSRDWGKMKKFAEGQEYQILDTLFFDFIDLAAKLQPKTVIAENVKGLTLGAARKYMIEIYKRFDIAGYYLQHFLLNAASMGVPQSRERVFFIAIRKDLAPRFLVQTDMFTKTPLLKLDFNFDPIPYSDIEDMEGAPIFKMSETVAKLWAKCNIGYSFNSVTGKNFFCYYKIDPSKPLHTITANKSRAGAFHYSVPRHLTKKELFLASSFPLDFKTNKPYYICGMSVPPVMMAQVSTAVFNQWLQFLK